MININKYVVIVIINWNGWQDTIECLESIYQSKYDNYDIIVVDNASEDDSIKKINDYCAGKIKIDSIFFDYVKKTKPIKIIKSKYDALGLNNRKIDSELEKLFLIVNKENLGFAEGNNVGIRFSLEHLNPDYILLLNNDTVVDKYLLTEMVNLGNSDETIGIVGPKIYYYDDPQTIWCIGGKISWKFARGLHIGNSELDIGQYEDVEKVEYVSGAAFLIKKEVLQKTGLMDKKLFLYFEETDLTLRASKLGYKSFYSPKAKIWHKVSKSGGGISKPIGLYYITRNRWIFMRKWSKKTDFIFFIIYQIIGALVLPFFLSIYKRNFRLFKAYYKGLWDGINDQ